jgi:hypothetical protein
VASSLNLSSARWRENIAVNSAPIRDACRCRRSCFLQQKDRDSAPALRTGILVVHIRGITLRAAST